MFYNCSSLKSLPDISKWNTNKVIDMSDMFYNCSSLKSLPDISKWNTKNMTNMFFIITEELSNNINKNIGKLEELKNKLINNLNLVFNSLNIYLIFNKK